MTAARRDAVDSDLRAAITRRRIKSGRLFVLVRSSSLKLNLSAGGETRRSVRTGRGSTHTHTYHNQQVSTVRDKLLESDCVLPVSLKQLLEEQTCSIRASH